MRIRRRIVSFLLALVMLAALLPVGSTAVLASGADAALTHFNVQIVGGTAVFVGKTDAFDGTAQSDDVLTVTLTPQTGRELKYWRSVNGQTIPGESFRMVVRADDVIWPVFTDTESSPFGPWECVDDSHDCEAPCLYRRVNTLGDVEYKWVLRNYGIHSYTYVDYDETQHKLICTNCDHVELEDHWWSSETVIREATHTQEGVLRRTCSDCGREVDTPIPTTTEHTYDGSWEIITPSVNGQPGVRRRTCTQCGQVQDFWYIKADWEQYYQDNRIVFTANYNSQWGDHKEGHYSFVNNDGNRTYVYGTSWAYENNERVVGFMWIDDPDELGRRPIYHAKRMVSGWGYGWALIGYADTFEEYIDYIDYLYMDQSEVSNASALFNMFRTYEEMYNEANLPASGSSDFFEGREYWNREDDSVIHRGLTYDNGLDIPVRVYTSTTGKTMYLDPETNTCLYYSDSGSRMYYHINSMTELVSDEGYEAMTEAEQAEVVKYSDLQKRICYDTENTTRSLWLEYLQRPTPTNFRVIVDGNNAEQYADQPGFDDPRSYRNNYAGSSVAVYHCTSDYAGGAYYYHGYNLHDFGIARVLQEPQNWYSNQNFSLDLKHAEPEGWEFLRWEKYNWQTGQWEEFTEVNAEGTPCLNYTEVNEDKTAFTVDHRLTDVTLVRARFREVPVENVHVTVTGGTFNRVTSDNVYYFDAEGDVPVGSWIYLIEDWDAAPAGKQFDHWTMRVSGVESEITYQSYRGYDCVQVTADTEFIPQYTDMEYGVYAWAENGTVYMDDEEYWGGAYTVGKELTFTTVGKEDYPIFLGWYELGMKGGKEEDFGEAAADTLLTTETTLHYTVTGEAQLVARWSDGTTEEEKSVLVTVDGGFATFTQWPADSANGFDSLLFYEPQYIELIDDPSDDARIGGWTIAYTDNEGTAHSDEIGVNFETGTQTDDVSIRFADYYGEDRTVTVTGNPVDPCADDAHVWSDYLYDEEEHWKVCTVCGTEQEHQDHAWDEGRVTRPTETETGMETHRCTVCEYERLEDLYGVFLRQAEGGTAAASVEYARAGEIVTLTATPAGEHVFGGWTVLQGGVEITDNAFTMPEKNVILQPIWRLNQYTLTFVTGTQQTLDPLTKAPGAAITLPTPIQADHRFVGWYRDENFWNPFNETVMPAEDLTLYAKWAVNDIVIQDTNIFVESTQEGYAFAVPVSVPSEEAVQTFQVMIGVYSADGRFLYARFAVVTYSSDPKSAVAELSLEQFETGAYLQIFVLQNGTWRPLADSKELELKP